MLTFKQYCKIHLGLSEEFLDAMKYNGEMLEIFVNPTAKEWRELNVDHDVRWVANMDTKKLWAWNGELGIHSPVLERVKKKHPEIKLTTSSEWEKHVPFLGTWIAGNTERSVYEHVDTWDWIEGLLPTRKQNKERDIVRQDIIDQLNQLLKKDFSWFNKYGPKGEYLKEMAVRFLASTEKVSTE